jgi:hypothetical protein
MIVGITGGNEGCHQNYKQVFHFFRLSCKCND